MKFNKLMLFLFISAFHFYSTAQDQNSASNTLQFPFLGTYSLQAEPGDHSRNFNQVAIGSNTFVLQMNGTQLAAYKIISEFKGGFRVEEFFPNGQAASGELTAFNVRIFSASENEYSVEIIYAQGSEKIHLVK